MAYWNLTICRHFQVEAEGCNYGAVQTSWATEAAVGTDGGPFSVPNSQTPAAAMDCEPTLQIGYG
jgi:MADS-box transcription factor